MNSKFKYENIITRFDKKEFDKFWKSLTKVKQKFDKF